MHCRLIEGCVSCVSLMQKTAFLSWIFPMLHDACECQSPLESTNKRRPSHTQRRSPQGVDLRQCYSDKTKGLKMYLSHDPHAQGAIHIWCLALVYLGKQYRNLPVGTKPWDENHLFRHHRLEVSKWNNCLWTSHEASQIVASKKDMDGAGRSSVKVRMLCMVKSFAGLGP